MHEFYTDAGGYDTALYMRDTCGGTDDNPNVTYHVCVASDGGAEDQCVAAFSEE